MAIPIAATIAAAATLLALLIWRAWRMFWPRSSLLDQPVMFFALIFLAMLALRWPLIVFVGELNVDESQMLAQAKRFLSHPIPWRDVDGTTSGPLNSLLLSVPMYFGAPMSWATARIVLLAANCAVVVLLFLTLRTFLTRQEAQFVLMPVIFFYAFASEIDFAHYSSETLSSVLLSASVYLLFCQWKSPQFSKTKLLLLGILLGAIPFAKLQAAPLAMFLAATCTAILFSKHRQSGRTRFGFGLSLLALAAGIALVPAIILGLVILNNAGHDFWISYILSSGKYATAESFLLKLKNVGFLMLTPRDFRMYFLSSLAVNVLALYIYRARKSALPGEVLWAFATVAIYCALTILCFIVAGKAFPHYVLLLVPPLTVFMGLVFLAGKTAIGSPTETSAEPRFASNGWLLMFAIIIVGLHAYKPPLRAWEFIRIGLPQSSPMPLAAASARAASQPGDTLSVWGWTPEYYLMTGLAPATRDAIGHYVISAGPYQDYFRERYLQDLRKSRPAIFIDAVADGNILCWGQWTESDRHESFPALAKFIEDNYSLRESFQMQPKMKIGPVRLYVLKERMAELHLSPANSNAPPVMDFQKK